MAMQDNWLNQRNEFTEKKKLYNNPQDIKNSIIRSFTQSCEFFTEKTKEKVDMLKLLRPYKTRLVALKKRSEMR